MIWCVEDDPGIREIEVYTLRSTGFEAEGFGDGEAFFQALRDRKPELVVLDVMLPGQDGVSILRASPAEPGDGNPACDHGHGPGGGVRQDPEPGPGCG